METKRLVKEALLLELATATVNHIQTYPLLAKKFKPKMSAN